MNLITRLNPQDKSDLCAADLKEMVTKFKRLVEPFHLFIDDSISEATAAAFQSKSDESKVELISQFNRYHELVSDSIMAGIAPTDSKKFVWRSLRVLGVIPPSDLLSYIDDEDLVEVYTRQQIQIFRNLKFFELCSYPLADILTVDWPSLYYRDEQVTAQLITQVMRSLSQPNFDVRPFDAPPHYLKEVRGHSKKTFWIEDRFLIPMKMKDSSLGLPDVILATKRASPIH